MLTYLVRPVTQAAQALAVARAAAPGARDPELCLLPYYRYTAEELRWDWPPTRPGDDSADPDAIRAPQLAERTIERNFLACAWDGLGLYSIGVRTTTLRLELLRTETLPADARVVAAEASASDALAHALRVTSPELLAQRAVLCGVLSLVYFPFWIVSLGSAATCRFAVVDAVTGTLVSADGPPHVRERLATTTVPAVTPIEPRVLLCPNCGWDLPDDPDHVVFFCGQCRRAWRLADTRLEPIAHTVAASPAGCNGSLQHHPLWLVDVPEAPPALRRIVVPAFRHRTLRLVLTLATLMTQKRPEPPTSDAAPADATGAYLDRDDALAVARFIATGIDASHAGTLALDEPRLVWWPFERLAGSLREPYTRFALPVCSVIEQPAVASAAGRR